MPLLRIESTVVPASDREGELLGQLSALIAQATGKPEQYVMVTFVKAAALIFGRGGDAVFVDVRSIGGLTGEINRQLSKRISQILADSLGIAADRIYLNFIEVEATHWGWNGDTFD